MAGHSRNAVLDFIESHLRDLSDSANANGLKTRVYMIEVAAMEAEYELTGEYPLARRRH